MALSEDGTVRRCGACVLETKIRFRATGDTTSSEGTLVHRPSGPVRASRAHLKSSSPDVSVYEDVIMIVNTSACRRVLAETARAGGWPVPRRPKTAREKNAFSASLLWEPKRLIVFDFFLIFCDGKTRPAGFSV